MPACQLLIASEGTWKGSSKLRLVYQPGGETITESSSTLSVELDKTRSFSQIHYDWEYEGEAHHGRFLIACNDQRGEVTAGWVDTWHQSFSVMHLKGTISEKGHLNFLGSYQVDDHPDWSWRIELDSHRGGLRIRMYNVSPDGGEELAVEGHYQR